MEILIADFFDNFQVFSALDHFSFLKGKLGIRIIPFKSFGNLRGKYLHPVLSDRNLVPFHLWLLKGKKVSKCLVTGSSSVL